MTNQRSPYPKKGRRRRIRYDRVLLVVLPLLILIFLIKRTAEIPMHRPRQPLRRQQPIKRKPNIRNRLRTTATPFI